MVDRGYGTPISKLERDTLFVDGFRAFNGPYVIVPILLGFRMWKPDPFGAPAPEAAHA